MPTYEYECHKCRYQFEKFQNMKDESLKTCPECGDSVQRLNISSLRERTCRKVLV